MRPRRVKFVWGASRVIRGRWYLGLFGLYDRIEGEHEGGLAISLRGLLAWGGVLLVAAYVGIGSAVFAIWERNPYSTLTYSDALLYPLRRTEIAEKKGRAFIAQGLDLYRAKKWHDAVRYLQLGLARCRDSRARLALARFYVLTNQRMTALRVLQDGLTDEFPERSYLEALFNAAEQGEDYEVVARIAERYAASAQPDIASKDRRWLREREFAATLAAGRAADALALAEKEEGSDAASERRVFALLALGRADDAVAFTQAWRARPRADVNKALRLQVRALREAKRFPEMETALKELHALTPADPAPLVYAIVQQAVAGRDAEANAAFDNYLFRFGGRPEQLLMLASPLGEIAALPLLQRCADAAAERGYPKARYQMLLVQTQARLGQWDSAAKRLEAMPPETGGQQAVANQLWRDWMHALLAATRQSTESAQLALLELLRDRPWPVNTFRQTVELLTRAERWDAAREAAAAALRVYPASKWLQTKSTEIAAQISARAIAANAPSTPAAATIGETVFLRKLDEFLGAANWEDAARHIQLAQAIQPPPRWLASHDAVIYLAQARIARGQGDARAAVAAGRLVLNGDDARSQLLLDFARECYAAQDKAMAVALAKEILRRTPKFEPARRALEEWEPFFEL